MFGKRNLLRDGAEAQAVVTAVKDGGVLTGGAGVPIHQYLDLRVTFDDGSHGEFSCRVGSMLHNNTLSFSEGDIVPVRYDPADRTKIELDEPALTAQRESLTEHRKEQAQPAVSTSSVSQGGSLVLPVASGCGVGGFGRIRRWWLVSSRAVLLFDLGGVSFVEFASLAHEPEKQLELRLGVALVQALGEGCVLAVETPYVL